MVISTFALACCLLGIALYFVSDKPKIAEIGRIMFSAGLLVLALHSVHVWRIG